MRMSPITAPYEPSSDTGHLELQTEPSSPTRQELEDVDRKLFEEDTVKRNEGNLVAIAREADAMLPKFEHIGQFYSPLQGIEEPPSSPQLRKPPVRDFKVEVPLTPPPSDFVPPWKRKHVSFSEVLHEIIPELPSPLLKPEDISPEDIDKLFAESVAPIAMQAERSIEQEQLQEADTMHRVKVPVMDFSLPMAPWKASAPTPLAASRNELYQQSTTDMKRIHFQKHTWPNSGTTELSLKWMPFPAALGRIETYETIPDEGVTDKFLTWPECVDSNTLVWKRDGLRIFDDLGDSDEEEIGYGIFPDDKDITSLLRKRKLQLEQAIESDSGSADDSAANWPLRRPVNHDAFRKIPKLSPRSGAEEATITHDGHAQNGQAEVIPDSFSAVNSLEGFMSLRNKGLKTSNLTEQRHFPGKRLEAAPNTNAKQQGNALSIKSRQAPSQEQSLALSAPKLALPNCSAPFVISTSFFLNRTLARRLQQLYPTAEMIERDFALHLTDHAKQSSRPGQGVPSCNTMADEADVILSPSTGLILTTLQKIKQRPLPGQVAKSAIRERIRRAAPRYERLLVIVSHDTSASSTITVSNTAAGQLDHRDCEALSEFTAFCSAMDDDCRAFLVAGTEETLAQWIVSLMIKYGLIDSNVRLLQDETLWEVFLRRAGMNAFAAQAILSELKPPDSDSSRYRSAVHPANKYGLSAFVNMSMEERLARFQSLLGGSNLLTRCSRTLDVGW
jgi:hypothetical protein